MNTLKDLTFDNIYHEHYNYWSLTSLVNFFKQFNLKIFNAEKIDTHGGSLRIYISKNKNINVVKKLIKFLMKRKNMVLKTLKFIKSLEKKFIK